MRVVRETRWCNSADVITVNGLTAEAFRLSTEYPDSFGFTKTADVSYYDFGSRIFKRDKDGVEVELTEGVSAIVRVDKTVGLEATEFVAQAAVPRIDLQSTDNLVLRMYVRWEGDVNWVNPYDFYIWQTPQLVRAVQLLSVPWRVFYWLNYHYDPSVSSGTLFFGDNKGRYNTRVENIHIKYRLLEATISSKDEFSGKLKSK